MDRHTGPARISENYLYALPLHGGDKDFGAIHRFTQRGGLTRRGRLFCSRGFHKRVGYYKGCCTGDQSLTAPSKKSTTTLGETSRRVGVCQASSTSQRPPGHYSLVEKHSCPKTPTPILRHASP